MGWKNVFVADKYCDLIYKWFDYMRDKYENKIYAYVIMPSHVHTLIHISDKSPNISKLIQNAKRFLAYQIIKSLEDEKNIELLNYFKKYARVKDDAKHKVFEDRYDSLLVQCDKLFLEKLNYIHNNPCSKKWVLADCIENYKYSSAANYIFGSGRYDIDIPDIAG